MPHRLSIALACLTLVPSLQAQDEWLYASTGNGLQVYDPETGEHLQSAYFPGVYGGTGLIYEGGLLYMMSQDGPSMPDHVVKIHPANSTFELLGDTGLNVPWAIYSLNRDPTTGEHYLIDSAGGIYGVDIESGQVSFLVRMEEKVTIITAIAIDSHGTVYGFGAPSIWYSRPALYHVDLHSGDLEHIGDIKGPALLFRTLAFDSKDRLWGAGHGPLSLYDYRLCRIDLESLQLESTFPLWFGAPWAGGLAFGPAPDVKSYCEPKPNSAGCAPTISWKGHPSASGHIGFVVHGTRIVEDALGFLMLGLGGPSDLPFQGGTLCVAEPILRTTPGSSGGSGGCTGSWSLDVNTWLHEHHPMAPGNSFTCQWWGRDPGLTGPNASQLSDALEVVLLP